MRYWLLVFMLLLCFTPLYSQVNLNSGLVAYYPFNGNANDVSGNGNNPIFNNATLTTDRLGNPNSAYSFNGIDNYIQIPNSPSLDLGNQISICAWVKVSGFYQGVCHGNSILKKGDVDFLPGNYMLRFDDSYYTNSQNCSIPAADTDHETFFGLNSSVNSSAPFIQTSQWYSVVYTSDGTTASVYVDCKLAGSAPAAGITFSNVYDLFFGKMNNAQFPYWFNGTMDEIRIYNRPLNEDEINAYGECSSSTFSCNNWLATPSVPSFVDIGKLNVTGNQITVEAVINRTTPYVPGGGDGTEGDVVSKHDNPSDVNYLLRPNHAFITTTNGFFATPDIPDLNLNQTYHIAMVYDGDTLKFYRDGCLMSKIAASGNLYQNNWDTRIGYYQDQIWNTNFIGYINEVRIWNIARTQAEIQTYMNTSLPNPTTQTGLLAYYTFDSLINKQGNPSWNGTLGGNASINQANTNCNSIDNLCVVSCNINVTKSSDTSLCGSSPVKIFASGGTTYSWFPTAGLSDPDIANPVATPLSSTKYYVTVTKDSGCSKIDSVTITVNNVPVITKSNDTSICINSSARLLAGGGTSYLWSPAATLNDPNIANPVATPVLTTTYKIEVTNGDGCSKTDSINVNVKPVPLITKSNDSTICNKTSVQLFVSGGTSYAWSPSSSLNNPASATPVASPLETTIYHVNITDASSCVYNDSVKITVRPPAVFSVSPDNSVCSNNSQQLNASGGDTYLWSPTSFLDNSNISDPVAAPDASITYSVTIKENTCHDSATLSTKLTVLPLPNIQVQKSNDITCTLPIAHLSAFGAQSYTWTPETGLDNAAIANPVTSPVVNTLYTVVGKGINGCTNSDTISVNVDFNGKVLYAVPNSFTPNGDGLNDCFGVKYWGHVDQLDFSIYNRFGQRVFHTNNPANCWDGTFEGNPQDAAVFVYIIKAKTACGNIERKGTVTLLR